MPDSQIGVSPLHGLHSQLVHPKSTFSDEHAPHESSFDVISVPKAFKSLRYVSPEHVSQTETVNLSPVQAGKVHVSSVPVVADKVPETEYGEQVLVTPPETFTVPPQVELE